jgi:hypothetical protein
MRKDDVGLSASTPGDTPTEGDAETMSRRTKLSALCGNGRFVAFAAVSLQFPDLAAEQLEEGVKSLGWRRRHRRQRRGREARLSSSIVLGQAEQLGAMIFSHPQNAPGGPHRACRAAAC